MLVFYGCIVEKTDCRVIVAFYSCFPFPLLSLWLKLVICITSYITHSWDTELSWILQSDWSTAFWSRKMSISSIQTDFRKINCKIFENTGCPMFRRFLTKYWQKGISLKYRSLPVSRCWKNLNSYWNLTKLIKGFW